MSSFPKRVRFFLLAVVIIGGIAAYSSSAVRCFVVLKLGLGTENATCACRLAQSLDEHARAGFSGAVLAVKNGQVLIDRGYGMANYEHMVPNTPKTKFRIGSITKPFTATAIMQLQEQGKLSANDPIANYLPDYPNGDKITIHHLLTHTSGIPNYTSLDEFEQAAKDKVVSIDELIGVFKDKPLNFQPGEKHAYSNSGFVLLTKIIEQISGQRYEEFVEENIFKPAGMHDTSFDRHAKVISDRASGYVFTDDGGFANADFWEMSWASGAGALLSTTGDLYRFDRALKTGKLLSDESLKEMLAPRVKINGLSVAYSWLVNEEGTFALHNGAVPGIRSMLERSLVDDSCLVMFCNKVEPLSKTRDEPPAVLDVFSILFADQAKASS